MLVSGGAAAPPTSPDTEPTMTTASPTCLWTFRTAQNLSRAWGSVSAHACEVDGICYILVSDFNVGTYAVLASDVERADLIDADDYNEFCDKVPAVSDEDVLQAIANATNDPIRGAGGATKYMPKYTRFTVDADMYDDEDDMLTAAAEDFADDADLEEWEVTAEWDGDDRERILITCPPVHTPSGWDIA